MKIKRKEYEWEGKKTVAYFVYCPACSRSHRFIVENEANPGYAWEFNGNEDSPTFHPSIRVHCSPWEVGGKSWQCHSYLKNGEWDFLDDSTHEVRGKVPMIDFPENFRV